MTGAAVEDLPRPSDRAAILVSSFGFSVGLGVATLIVPLLALESGYDPATVGFLAAAVAVSQLTTRLGVPWLLGRFADRTLIAGGCLLMALAFSLIIASTALPVFFAAQLLQGAARAIFWTSSQTHAVRAGGPTVRRLVDLSVAGNAGTLTGPTLGGLLVTSGFEVGLAAAIVAVMAGASASLVMRRLSPFDRQASAGTLRLLARPGVDVACWASVVGGGWWSMVGSYIPVILVGAGIGPQGIGLLITLSEGAGVAALLALRSAGPAVVPIAVRVAAFSAMAALAGMALVPANAVLYGILMAIGGASSGTVTNLAPAMASLVAGPQEQGDAMALSGTFRAAALLAAPAAAGALLSAVPIPGAVTIVAAALGLPGFLLGHGRR
jgi:MFS family permease